MTTACVIERLVYRSTILNSRPDRAIAWRMGESEAREWISRLETAVKKRSETNGPPAAIWFVWFVSLVLLLPWGWRTLLQVPAFLVR